ncbi:hypothetical protein AX769_18225 [Frondihabitans sp. PAMC 28766]|uniref:acyl-CoA carboxylase epsilon subunit n=1 Tax=Frondihabitans sp. PAMC 28766 TaxID=1795630 RepID=UPI00078EAAF7|nr:acyl-CoA carboxylase epsilon subunit [Frondihabitans sp. PAMC 28766]AMM21730.1 hypothetical protein AX769_18225 [Frondihabitans sp. PAMC 28766]
MSGKHSASAAGDAASEGAAVASAPAAAEEATGADPTIRVVAGDPTDAELAAVTAVLAALAAEEAANAAARLSRPQVESAWSQSRRPLRQPVHAGPEQWRRYPA